MACSSSLRVQLLGRRCLHRGSGLLRRDARNNVTRYSTAQYDMHIAWYLQRHRERERKRVILSPSTTIHLIRWGVSVWCNIVLTALFLSTIISSTTALLLILLIIWNNYMTLYYIMLYIIWSSVYTVFATIDIPVVGGGALGVFPIAMSVMVAHLFLLPIDGCSINPSRSFGPSLIAAMAGIGGRYYHQQYM